jgi:galactoside 2-L-fucosyltransferase 1/2
MLMNYCLCCSDQAKTPSKVVYVVCSDDINWCRNYLKSANSSRHVVFVSTQDPLVDMAVLAQCQHSIITVGTFGWWSAWLANGTTVYYGDWPAKGSSLDLATSHSDYFYPHWIPL